MASRRVRRRLDYSQPSYVRRSLGSKGEALARGFPKGARVSTLGPGSGDGNPQKISGADRLRKTWGPLGPKKLARADAKNRRGQQKESYSGSHTPRVTHAALPKGGRWTGGAPANKLTPWTPNGVLVADRFFACRVTFLVPELDLGCVRLTSPLTGRPNRDRQKTNGSDVTPWRSNILIEICRGT